MNEEEDYSQLFIPSFHSRYIYPPPEYVPPQPQVIIPQMGAGKYFYVDPRAGQTPNPVMPQTEQAPKGIGLLPPNAMNILLKEVLGRAPRLADDRGDLLKDTEDTFYGGGHTPPQPTPTPTPTRVVRRTGVSMARYA